MEWLAKELNNLNKMYTGGFSLDTDIKLKYVDALKDLRVDYMTEVLMDMWKWKSKKLVTVGEIRDEYQKVFRKHNPVRPDNQTIEVTKSEAQLRDNVMQCMYLYYKHRFEFVSNFEFVKTAYKKIFGDEPYDFNKFKSKITEDMVYKYVESKNEQN